MSVTEIFNNMDYGLAPESTANAQAWLDENDSTFGHYIDGKWQQPSSNKWFNSSNPATGKKLAKIAQGSAQDVDQAVAAATKAHAKWQKLGGHGRARHLYALARLLQKHSRVFAVLESMDNGKPIRESRDVDIPLAVRHFYHHAGWAQLANTEFEGFESIGVVGQIIPWNFPLLMLAWKIAPALAAGNTVVLKPAEFTSLTALRFAQLCEEAGLPAGVVNIVTGDGATGSEIVKHEGVKKIAFTGSTDVGRLIKSQTAGTGKKLTLELGGKSPFIVFDDADLDSAVEGLVDAIWFNQGQVCCAGSRLLVQESVADQVIAKIKARMKNLRVGDPLDKNTDVGAIIDESQRARIDQLVAQGVEAGAELWQADGEAPKSGCYYKPTLLTQVEACNPVANVEIFGPVLSVLTFRTQQEAVALANNTRYGLAASVWSENINRSLHVAPQIKAGVIWVNSTNQFDAAVGFGGYKESGMGREGGKEGMFEYLKPIAGKTSKEVDVKPKALKASKAASGMPSIDQTAKMYIGGKQARPDSGNSITVVNAKGEAAGLVGEGSRKDIRNAVEAAFGAASWSSTSAHNRAQILFYIGENLSFRSAEFSARLVALTGCSAAEAKREVELSIERLFFYAAWADKFDGAVHQPPVRGVAMAMNEAIGIVGVGCPDSMPLLSMISMVAPVIAMGNRAVVVPSQAYPLLATDFYQVLETSDLPGGVVNIVTGERDVLMKVVAEHNQVDAIWYHGSEEGSAMLESAAVGNLKRTWMNQGVARDWLSNDEGQGKLFLQQATQVKNIWVPYGDAI